MPPAEPRSAPAPRAGLARSALSGVLPPAAALGLGLLIWQVVVWTGWRPEWVLPAPAAVFGRVVAELVGGDALAAARITLGRAATGYALAVAIGTGTGLAMSRVPALRTAVGALITGLQTMPSVAWFPLAILLFQLGEEAIVFVVVLGAAPSVANGLLDAVDHVPPALVRAGLKQGWAFSWRSLMAGDLLVIVGDRPAIGTRLHYARELSDAEGLLAWMIVVLSIGILVGLALFGTVERRVRSRRGLCGA